MRRSHAVNEYERFITIRCVCLLCLPADDCKICSSLSSDRASAENRGARDADSRRTNPRLAVHKPFREIKRYQPRQRDKERIPCAPFHAGVELRGYGVSSAIRNAALFPIAARGDDAVLTLRQNDREWELWLSPRLRFPSGSSRIERIWRSGIRRLIGQERLSGEALQSAV